MTTACMIWGAMYGNGALMKWSSADKKLRVASRNFLDPQTASQITGFRCVRTPKP